MNWELLRPDSYLLLLATQLHGGSRTEVQLGMTAFLCNMQEGLEGALSLPPKRHSRLLKSSMSIRRSTPVIAESLLMPPQETGDKGPTTGDSPLKPDTPAQIGR